MRNNEKGLLFCLTQAEHFNKRNCTVTSTYFYNTIKKWNQDKVFALYSFNKINLVKQYLNKCTDWNIRNQVWKRYQDKKNPVCIFRGRIT